MRDGDLARVLEIARELQNTGRRSDAELLARLAAEAEGDLGDFEPDLPADELDRRLERAKADIAAGRLTPNEEAWASIHRRRAADGRP